MSTSEVVIRPESIRSLLGYHEKAMNELSIRLNKGSFFDMVAAEVAGQRYCFHRGAWLALKFVVGEVPDVEVREM